MSEIAKSYQKQCKTEFTHKNDGVCSIVTAADLAISEKFKEEVNLNFHDRNYIIIDEETLGALGQNPALMIEESEYQFVIDPIDGTHTFALGMPDYAISVGILKKGKPYQGAICLPGLGELLYLDEIGLHHLSGLGTSKQQEVLVEKKQMSPLAVIFANDWFIKFNDRMNFKTDVIMGLYSCVVHFYYMSLGKAKGYYFGSYLWDMAGAWPMLDFMGFEFRHYKTGKKLDGFDRNMFTPKMKIKDLHLVCRSEDFEHLKEIANLRDRTAL